MVHTATVVFGGETYTATHNVQIPAGHTYGEPTWTWSKSYHSASATFTCENNDDAQTVVATVTEVPTPDATCDEDGVMVHTATVVYGGETYTATQNVRIPATEHSYGEPSWSWSADHRTVTATFTCTKCDGTKIVTENATQEVVSEATATADEVVKYTVTVEVDGKTYTAETENITVPGTATGDPGHTDPTDPTDPTNPTDPEQPAGDGLCKWCGEDHSGSFWQRIVGFFHAIIYFFAHLFGLR